jgi:hypothetical protein
LLQSPEQSLSIWLSPLEKHAGHSAVRMLAVQLAATEKTTVRPWPYPWKEVRKIIQVSPDCARFPKPWTFLYARETSAQTTGLSIQQCLHDPLRRTRRAMTSTDMIIWSTYNADSDLGQGEDHYTSSGKRARAHP